MNDPAAARKPKGWPLFAIALLVALLAGFLFLRWRKREDVPAVVKPPAPAAAPAPAEIARKPGPPEPPVAPAPPTEEAFAGKLAELRKAVGAKNWEEAAGLLEAARKLRPADPALDPLEKEIAEGKT